MNRLLEIREATLRKLIWYGCDMGAQAEAQERLTRTVIPRPRMIHDLPPEIMGEIFKFLLATGLSLLGSRITVNRHLGIRYPQGGVLKLAHVCQYWRAVVLSIKVLWASFDVTFLPPEAWAYWSSFSGSYPLRLQYWPATDHPDLSTVPLHIANSENKMTIFRSLNERKLKRANEMLRHFTACADRWDALYFDCAYAKIAKAVADMLHTTASRSPLRKLEILMPFQINEQPPEEVVDKLVGAISSFPSLRDLVWQSTSRSILPRALPWHALENVYIKVGYVRVEDCITCLMQCTSAKTFAIHQPDRYSCVNPSWRHTGTVADTFKPDHCTLPKLESLTIAERCDPYLLLGYFTLPSLVSLHVHDLIGSVPALQDFLVRSQCPLRTFTAKEVGAFSDEMIGCLSASCLQSTLDLRIGVNVSAEDYLALIKEKRPDVFDVVPRLVAWTVPLYNGEERHYIGWDDSNTEKS